MVAGAGRLSCSAGPESRACHGYPHNDQGTDIAGRTTPTPSFTLSGNGRVYRVEILTGLYPGSPRVGNQNRSLYLPAECVVQTASHSHVGNGIEIAA